MKLAFALLLTASLHAQIVVINPTDNGAVSLNKINANFAYLDLHGGGGTVTGSSAQVLVNGGSPGSCSTGTCTVSLAGPIYFNPVPGVYSGITIGPYVGSGAYAAGLTVGVPTGATTNLAAAFGGGVAIGAASGNANAISNFVPTGLTQTFVEPGQISLPSVGNVQAGASYDIYAGGLFNPAGYGNVAGEFFRTTLINGMNSNDNANKDTMYGNEFNTAFPASGQRYGMAVGTYFYGAGDAFALNLANNYNNRSTAYGDEGTKILDLYLDQIFTPITQSSTTATVSACGATAISANVSSSSGPSDIRTIPASGTLTACHKGDWVDMDNGTNVNGAAGPSGDAYHEAFQLTADASGGNIYGLLHLGHCANATGSVQNGISTRSCAGTSTPAPLAPAQVLSVTPIVPGPYGSWGQNGIVVDSTATPYTAGTGAYISAQNLSYPWAVVTGVGSTNWTSLTHSGTDLQYCIAFDADTYTRPNGTNQAWFRIAAINSNTSLNISSYTGTAIGVGNTSTYGIVPCGEIMEMVVGYGSTTDSITGLVMASTPNNWVSGHNIYQTVEPAASVPAGVQSQFAHYGPIGAAPDMYSAIVNGGTPAHGLLVGEGSPITSSLAAYQWGVITPSTQNAAFFASSISMVGLAMELDTSATAIPGGSGQPPGTTGDPKAIFWKGDSSHDQGWIYPGATNTGFTIDDSAGARLNLWSNGTAYARIDASATVDRPAVFTLPSYSGTIFAPPGQVSSLTLPSAVTSTVAIGRIDSQSYPDQAAQMWACSVSISTGNQCSLYYIGAPATVGGGSSWYIVAPSQSSADAVAFQVEILASYSPNGVSIRLRPTTAGVGLNVWYTLFGFGQGAVIFTPDGTTTATTAPTAYWDSSFMTQSANKLTLNYTSAASATIDPTNITAARSYPLPDVSGTPGVFPASAVINSAVCIKSASPLSLGYCSSVVGVGGTCTCN